MDDEYEAIYPDPASPERIPIFVIIREDVSDSDVDDLGMREWKAESDPRPVIMLRAREARSRAGEIYAAVARLEKLADGELSTYEVKHGHLPVGRLRCPDSAGKPRPTT
jgi:hypothetical protein